MVSSLDSNRDYELHRQSCESCRYVPSKLDGIRVEHVLANKIDKYDLDSRSLSEDTTPAKREIFLNIRSWHEKAKRYSKGHSIYIFTYNNENYACTLRIRFLAEVNTIDMQCEIIMKNEPKSVYDMYYPQGTLQSTTGSMSITMSKCLNKFLDTVLLPWSKFQQNFNLIHQEF